MLSKRMLFQTFFYVATVVILLKPDKDPEECSSYRPISLLNIDYKILTTILSKQDHFTRNSCRTNGVYAR